MPRSVMPTAVEVVELVILWRSIQSMSPYSIGHLVTWRFLPLGRVLVSKRAENISILSSNSSVFVCIPHLMIYSHDQRAVFLCVMNQRNESQRLTRSGSYRQHNCTCFPTHTAYFKCTIVQIDRVSKNVCAAKTNVNRFYCALMTLL